MRGFFESYLQGTESRQPVTNHLEQMKALKLEPVPLEGEAEGGDERPAWLRAVYGEVEPAPPEPETRKVDEQPSGTNGGEGSVVEKILSNSEFKLELEPMTRDDDKEDADKPPI